MLFAFLLLSSYRVVISKKRALMSVWSLWISGVSVYEGDAINGVASGSVRLYNSDFFISIALAIGYALLCETGNITVEEVERRQCLLVCYFSSSSNRGQGVCAIRSSLQSTWRPLLFSESVLEPQSGGLSVLWSLSGAQCLESVLVVLSCLQPLRDPRRRAEILLASLSHL